MSEDFLIYFFDPENDQIVKRPLEDMVKILLPSQIDISFQLESLKAQAVIIRTNLIRNSLKLGGKGCEKYENVDLCKSNHCHDFYSLEELKDIWKEDFEMNIEKIEKAVKETEGDILTIEGKPIMALYHNTCGGSTENSENIIKNKVVYLRKVLCDYCIESPNWEESKEYFLEEIEKKLNIKFSKDDLFKKGEISGYIDNIVRDEENRVRKIKIGGKEFTGSEIMELLDLSSNRFYICPVSIKIVSRGSGEGLGYCQYGGNEMARRGHTYKEILDYYYTGTKVERCLLPSIKKPLMGKVILIDPGHGGEDFGYIGNNGLKEKDIVLSLSKEIKPKLERLGAKVYLTRNKDENILLNKRTKMADSIRPDFFISFHMDFFANSNNRGCKAYYFRGDEESKKLGVKILEEIERDINIKNKGVREGDFYLLKNLNTSSLIIELGYLSNLEEEKKFSDKRFIKQFSEAIGKGILQYFEY